MVRLLFFALVFAVSVLCGPGASCPNAPGRAMAREVISWTGWWNGVYGTWQFSAPLCNDPKCDMCNGPDGIRARLRQQSARNRAAREVSQVAAQNAIAAKRATQANPAASSAGSSGASSSGITWEYRQEPYAVTETRYRSVRKKFCNGVTCYYAWVNEPYTVSVTRYRQVAYPVRSAPREPRAGKSEPPGGEIPRLPPEILDTKGLVDLKSTPLFVVDAMLEELNPARGEKVFDPGCGDGRFLLRAAASYEAEAIGIELDSLLVAKSRERALSAGLGRLVHVFEGDVRDYDLSEADYVVAYLYEDLFGDVVSRLPAGCRIASYLHPIPGIESKKHIVRHAGSDYVYYTGEK